MARMYHRIIRKLMILSFAVLPGGFIECDLEDGELEVDLEEIDLHRCNDELFIDVWYDGSYDYCCY